MFESCLLGTVREVLSNEHFYRGREVNDFKIIGIGRMILIKYMVSAE